MSGCYNKRLTTSSCPFIAAYIKGVKYKNNSNCTNKKNNVKNTIKKDEFELYEKLFKSNVFTIDFNTWP